MKNILIQYKGGGYDGCVWEWNYAVFDQKGKFYDIISSGSAGIDLAESMRFYISDKQNRLDKDFYLYNFSNAEDLKNFVKESNPHHVKAVGEFLQENLEFTLNIPCTICEENCGLDPEEFDCQIENGSIYCNECHSLRSCGFCGEFWPYENDCSKDDFPFDENGYCEYCVAEVKNG